MTSSATDINPQSESIGYERYGMASTMSHYISDLLETLDSYRASGWMDEGDEESSDDLGDALERAQAHWISIMMGAGQ